MMDSASARTVGSSSAKSTAGGLGFFLRVLATSQPLPREGNGGNNGWLRLPRFIFQGRHKRCGGITRWLNHAPDMAFTLDVQGRDGVVEVEQSKAARFRDTAKAIRQTAEQAHDPAVRDELFALADRYERMAERAERQAQGS